MKKTLLLFLSAVLCLAAGCSTVVPDDEENERKDIPLSTKQGEYVAAGNDFAYAGSLCHGWSSLPCYYFRAGVLGVTPTAPGFAKFRVDPDAAGLTHAAGEVPTPYGPIHVEWRLDKAGQPQITSLDAPPQCHREN